jgi:hypothetical protein
MNQIVYCETVKTFLDHCANPNIIGDKIKQGMYNVGYTNVMDNWITSWENSLPEIATALRKSSIDEDVDVAVEYRLKHSLERIDFLIYGLDDAGNKNMVIVELKQWSQVNPTSSLNKVHTMIAKGVFEDHFHPSYQALNYAGQLKNFNSYVQNESVGIKACSYCHNMDTGFKTIMDDVNLYPFVIESPSFLKGETENEKLASFISRYVSKKSHNILYEINNAKMVPSDTFAKQIREALNGNQMYSLDANQANSLSTIVDEVKKAHYYNQKKTIIIKGGAGTGKSIIAINALGQLNSPKKKDNRITTFYVTVNAAPKKTMYNSLTLNRSFPKSAIEPLFKYPTVFTDRPKNEVPCILVDEAHRLFKWKGGVGLKSGVNVLKELINAAQVSVFFIDDNQAVTVDDYANIDIIKQTAYELRSEVIMGKDLELTNQYRVQGGAEYIAFIKYFLGLSDEKITLGPNKSYDFRIFDDPNLMYNKIRKRDNESKENQGLANGQLTFDLTRINGHARMVAGYCYEWVSDAATRDGQYDINIPEANFKAKWNLRYGTGLNAYSWVDDPLSINEIGCVHTCQGVDLDYCGVIIGKDITYKDGKICFNKKEHPTSDLSGIRTASDQVAEQLIKNSYYVLLTRGVKGTYIYCEDKALREYLKTLKNEGSN